MIQEMIWHIQLNVKYEYEFVTCFKISKYCGSLIIDRYDWRDIFTTRP